MQGTVFAGREIQQQIEQLSRRTTNRSESLRCRTRERLIAIANGDLDFREQFASTASAHAARADFDRRCGRLLPRGWQSNSADY
jgi:hypothetical protein